MKRIEIGFRCNNACAFCALGTLRQELPEIEPAVIEAQIAEIHSGDRVAFVGGEPTLFAMLPEWATQARERGAWSVLVQTNGRRLAEPGYAHRLVAAGVDALDVSVHGATAAVHDALTTVPGSHAATLEGLERARAVGLCFGITCVVTPSNRHELPAVVRLADELGARGLHLSLAEAVGSALEDAARIVPTPEACADDMERARQLARQLGVTLVRDHELGRGSSPQWFAGRGRAEAPVEEPNGSTRRLPLLD